MRIVNDQADLRSFQLLGTVNRHLENTSAQYRYIFDQMAVCYHYISFVNLYLFCME